MIGTYRTAWRLAWRNRSAFMLFAVVFAVFDLFIALSDTTGAGVLVAYLGIVLLMHRAVLLDEPLPIWSGGPRGAEFVGPFSRFVGVAILFLALASAAGVATVLALRPRLGQDAAGLAYLAFYLAYFVVLSLWGTALPAAALGERRVLRAAWRRARSTGWRVAGGLMAGPTLFTVLVAGAGLASGRALGLGGEVAPEVRVWWLAVALDVPFQLIGLFVSALAVAVLCRAYARTAPTPM